MPELTNKLVAIPASRRVSYYALGTLVFIIILLMASLQLSLESFSISMISLVLLPIIAVFVLFLFGVNRMRFEPAPVTIVENVIPALEPVPREISEWEKAIYQAAEHWTIRYPLGVILFVVCAVLFEYVTGLPGSWTNNIVYWLGLLVLFMWAIVCMREVLGFAVLGLIVGGIAYAFFGMLAAVPVSVAIIIGALIIANSLNK